MPSVALGVEKTKKLAIDSVTGEALRPETVPVLAVKLLSEGTNEAKLPVSPMVTRFVWFRLNEELVKELFDTANGFTTTIMEPVKNWALAGAENARRIRSKASDDFTGGWVRVGFCTRSV